MMNNMTTFTEEQKKRKQENAQKTLGSNQAFAGLTDFQKLYEMIVEAFGYSAEDLMKEMAPEDQMKTQGALEQLQAMGQGGGQKATPELIQQLENMAAFQKKEERLKLQTLCENCGIDLRNKNNQSQGIETVTYCSHKKDKRMKMNKTLEEPKNWEKGNVIKSSVGELDHMLLIEAVIPNTCVIFTRKIWYENGKMVQAPLGFDDINDLYTYGWRKTNPVSSNFAFENQSNEK